ncbi:MAG: hypothetical protein IPM85_14440 [Chitinophagaceae bacterium]|nr:hypothetical protein [Chitinophagaceae bacterium]
MTSYLQDYKQYYLLRMKRYEGNPVYSESYFSEKAIYDAVSSCSTLEEFRQKLGDLNEKNAIALIIDEYTIRQTYYLEMNDPIRAEGCSRIINTAKNSSNVTELITLVSEEENKTSLALTADTIYPFTDSGYLERITVWMEADVPDRYKAQYHKYAEEEKVNLRKAYAETEKEIGNWQPGWKFNFDRINEVRHRRLLPFPDGVTAAYIAATKQILTSTT